MQRVLVTKFGNIGLNFGGLYGSILSVGTANAALDQPLPNGHIDIKDAIEMLEALGKQAEELGLAVTLAAVKRQLPVLQDPKTLTHRHVANALIGTYTTLSDELGTRIFLAVDHKDSGVYEEPLVGWDAAVAKFPSVAFDVEESSKCLALNRYTSSVFHSMRILEIGLESLARHYALPFDRPNWHEVLVAIEKRIKGLGPNDGPSWRDEQQFGSEACASFRHFKDAWRNHTMHARERFDDERATIVREHVRHFMNHLATRLEEQP